MSSSTSVQGTNPAEDAVVFVNSEVLAPPAASPMTGAAKIMIDQSAGMMVQDLQSFLKGFEQLGLIAVSRLANNFLTYGTYFGPATDSTAAPEKNNVQFQDAGKGNEVMRDLFKMVSDYAEVKSKISTMMYTKPLEPEEKRGTDSSSDLFEEDDPEKKNDLQ
ncbi:hypothetical protein M2347_000041 [Chryseobacterium sp. H1D6B]|uniref:hypothetical protein n=1 Tax=Chryseobacterium sp. H1D6B TaxID=2940588 RepID=UPI0015CDF7D7|nr:hypothetical protein [Chryseobacterium sp. H1D6B]MDH6250314.1 hypothetical protein [Chryseobacterium sp. H1D6B]